MVSRKHWLRHGVNKTACALGGHCSVRSVAAGTAVGEQQKPARKAEDAKPHTEETEKAEQHGRYPSALHFVL